MKDNKLIEIARDLAKAIADSGDINVILFAFIFVVSIIAVVTAAAVEPLVLLSLIPLVIFFVWRIPLITRLGRTARTKEKLLAHLQGICRATAQRLSLDGSLVRSNIFTQSSDGMLRIVPGWHYNMDDRPAELTIEIPTGYGATGNAFQSRVAVIARARGGWGDHKLSPREMEKLHPELKWIVSTPIPKPNGGGDLLGVVNVDGLYEDRTADQLKPVQQEMVWWSAQIAKEIHHGA